MAKTQSHKNMTEEKTMIDYAAHLQQNSNGVLATQDENGVCTRVFRFLFADGNKVYFGTHSEKSVYRQLKANPGVSFCAYPRDFNPVLSVSGKAVFVEDAALKTRVLDESPMFKKIFGTPDNPLFKLFYIDVEEVKTFNFSDGPKSYKVS
jgi:uncharacterized pyridoxamine 5'-phosphate oxidase family protein